MGSLNWSEDDKLELQKFKSQLSPQSLKIAGKAIGLGEVVKKKAHINPIFAELTKAKMPPKSPPQYSSRQAPTAQRPSNQPPLMPPRLKKGRPWFKWLTIHLVDLSFVLSTMLVGVLSFAIILDFNKFISGQLFSLLPIRMIHQLSIVSLGAIIYGLFLVYYLFFRFALGSTLGESIVTAEHKKN